MSTRVHIDLTGATAPYVGDGWEAVTVTGDWDDVPHDRLRQMAADFYGVPIEQVGHPEPAEWPEERGGGDALVDAPIPSSTLPSTPRPRSPSASTSRPGTRRDAGNATAAPSTAAATTSPSARTAASPAGTSVTAAG